MDVNEIADRLYTVPPRQFVAERDAAVAAARRDGDREAAARLAKLRRPTVAAWLVNLLALREPGLIGELVDLAEQLRQAQLSLDGTRLRELAARRRQLVAGLVARARTLGLAEDRTATAAKLPLAEVEATLHAALADPAVAEQVRTGRLTRAVESAGFGELPPPRLRLITGEGGRSDGPEPAGDESTGGRSGITRAEAERRLAAARAAVEAATAELNRCTARQQALKRELADLDARLAELTAQREALARQLVAAEAAGLAARRAVAQARRQVGEAEATLHSAD